MNAVVRFACEIRRVSDDCGIDDERPGRIVVADGETGAISVRGKATGDGALHTVDLLVNQRFSLAHLRAACRRYHQRAADRIHFEPLGAVEVERDLAWIGAGRDNEIVFELPAFTVIDKV